MAAENHHDVFAHDDDIVEGEGHSFIQLYSHLFRI